ncbi:MAG: hypothetical protein HWE10_13610 [Gammaproteobacteria bacterium]|nr:hypothetical protein [Gammaproteobacteria bacterium]
MQKTEFFKKVNAPLSNTRWSWVGVNEELNQAFFIVINDKKNGFVSGQIGSRQFVIRESNWNDSSAGFNEQSHVIQRCISGEFSAQVVLADFDKELWDSEQETSITGLLGQFYFEVEVEMEASGAVLAHEKAMYRLDKNNGRYALQKR